MSRAGDADAPSASDTQRIDKWLWFARLIKTRTLASVLVTAGKVRLNYLVNNCGWSPAYTMRSADDRKKVRVEYNALIHQLSGEDWSNVSLTLSTASPALSAAGPGLAPFHVTLMSEGQANAPAAPETDRAAGPASP